MCATWDTTNPMAVGEPMSPRGSSPRRKLCTTTLVGTVTGSPRTCSLLRSMKIDSSRPAGGDFASPQRSTVERLPSDVLGYGFNDGVGSADGPAHLEVLLR